MSPVTLQLQGTLTRPHLTYELNNALALRVKSLADARQYIGKRVAVIGTISSVDTSILYLKVSSINLI